MTNALKITPATTGLASHVNAASHPALADDEPGQPLGVASSSSGGMKYDSIMCWSMWAE